MIGGPITALFIAHVVAAAIFFVLLWRQGARGYDWGVAALKLLLVWLVSNLPLFFVIFDLFISKTDNKNYLEILLGFFNAGESLYYVSAILSPVLISLLWNMRDSAKVYLTVNVVAIILSLVIASSLYMRTLSNTPIDENSGFLAAITLYFVSLMVWYFSMVYEDTVANQSPGERSNKRAKEIQSSLP